MTEHITSDPRPHFIPGFYSWLAENFAKVHVVVIADHPMFIGPPGLPLTEQPLTVANPEDCNSPYVHKFRTVILNIGCAAVNNFHQDAEGYSVDMRFAGSLHSLYIPFDAVVCMYTPDNQQVQAFQFILRPGQEEYSVDAPAKKEVVRVNSSSAGNDNTIVKPVAQNQPRPSHLRLVK